METIRVERDGGVVTVVMDRPHRKNAATATMFTELARCFEEVEQRQDDRVLVLTGAGGDFCSGADLVDPDNPLRKGAEPHLVQMRRVGDTVLALHRLTKPTIARVDGVAVGIGMSLALGCDLVVASERARFSLIFSRRGLSLDGGSSWLLPHRIGAGRAKQVALFGGMYGADEARDLGIVNRVVPVDELDAFVGDWARTLAAGPPVALSMTKTLLDHSWSATLAEALEDEARCQALNMTSVDTAEAMAAFLEKREPRFVGR